MEYNPSVSRTIIFIRHGQYKSNPEKLTKLGQLQAMRTAQTLKAFKSAKLYCSSMPRAQETAGLISGKIRLNVTVKDFFRESLLPGTAEFHKYITKNLDRKEKAKFMKKIRAAQKKADQAFDFLFQKPKSGQNVEVVVAHGNVIRYWVCKALKIDSKKWTSMDVSHASLTTIRMSESGNFVLLGFSDIGHLPHRMRTYT